MKGFQSPLKNEKETKEKSKKPTTNSLKNALLTFGVTSDQFVKARTSFIKDNPGGNPVLEYIKFKKYLKNTGVKDIPESINALRG